MTKADVTRDTVPDSLSSRLELLMREAGETYNSLAEKLPDGPDRATIRRILKEPNHSPRLATLKKLEAHFKCDGFLTETTPRADPPNSPPEHRLTGSWWEYIPTQPGRPYSSVDKVMLNQGRGRDAVEGTISRILSTRSPTDVGEQWKASGVAMEERFAYLVFHTVTWERPDSNGVIALRRLDTFRRLDGVYLRHREIGEPEKGSVDRSTGAYCFNVSWHRDAASVANISEWDFEQITQP